MENKIKELQEKYDKMFEMGKMAHESLSNQLELIKNLQAMIKILDKNINQLYSHINKDIN